MGQETLIDRFFEAGPHGCEAGQLVSKWVGFSGFEAGQVVKRVITYTCLKSPSTLLLFVDALYALYNNTCANQTKPADGAEAYDNTCTQR